MFGRHVGEVLAFEALLGERKPASPEMAVLAKCTRRELRSWEPGVLRSGTAGSVEAVEQEYESRFRDLCNRRCRFPVSADSYKDRLRGQVVVPKVVMNGLKVPDAFAGSCFECYNRVAEQIRSGPVTSIHARSMER